MSPSTNLPVPFVCELPNWYGWPLYLAAVRALALAVLARFHGSYFPPFSRL